ncbi:MAG: hypothetical protein IJN36_04880, partial [Clostridia bacterium]|nr:hypothetical protein [Clostridia bacterium]
MKKKILALICILSMLATMAPAMGAMAASEKAVMFEKDFLVNGSPLADDGDTTEQRNNVELDSGLSCSEYSGFAYATQIGTESDRGNSLKLGITESGGSLPSLNIPVGDFQKTGKEGSLTLEFDYYINEKTDYNNSTYKNKNNETFRLAFYGAGNKTAVYWDQSLVNNFSSKQTFDYDTETWYRGKLLFEWKPNTTTGKFNYYFTFSNGNDVMTNHDIKNQTSIISQIRLYVPKTVDGEKCIALDNITIKQVKDDPTITGVEGSVAYNTQSIGINLSDYVYNLTAEDVELLDEEGNPVDISTASFDSSNKRITINLGEELKPLSTYKVLLKTTTEVDIAGT